MMIYIAAPLGEVKRALLWKDRFEHDGFTVCSTWHDLVGEGAIDPRGILDRARILETNVRELDKTDILFVDTSHGTPRATYGEVGYALARARWVVWYQPDKAGANIWDAHPLVTIAEHSQAVMEALQRTRRMSLGAYDAAAQ